ncbi:MAG: DUF1259 domain-containing protein [Vulcanibacillus sp.]
MGGKPIIINGVCVVNFPRADIFPTIFGRRTKSSLVVNQKFSFESIDSKGRALNLGEVVLLKNEIIPFFNSLYKSNLLVSIHNHWLSANPSLTHIHFQSIENPIIFAYKVKKAFATL